MPFLPSGKVSRTQISLTKSPDMGMTYLSGLLLEGVEDTVDELLLQPGVNVSSSQVSHCLLNTLHHHLTVLLVLVLEIVHHSVDDLRRSHFVCDFHSCVHQLSTFITIVNRLSITSSKTIKASLKQNSN